MSDKNKELLQNILNEHPVLEELYMAWNNLRAPSGAAIFSALQENKSTSLKVLDLSCNNLGLNCGLNMENGCAQQISDCFQKNDELVHVDISYNRFNTSQAEIIAAGLEKNHTIYGIHFAGNAGYVDSRGFIVVQKDMDDIEIDCGILRQNIDGVKQVQNKIARHHRDINLKDCCWICQGWEEMTFKWTKDVSGQGETDPLFIHFNFENFQPCYYGKIDGNVLEYTRMIPPGDLCYFFSNGQGDEQNIANDHTQQKVGVESLLDDVKLIEGEKKNIKLTHTNYAKVAVKTNMFVQYTPRTNVKPRIRDPEFIPDKKKKTKKKWTFPISLMYKWKPDTEDLIAKCFDFDWSLSRILKVIKKEDELEKVRVFLKERYQYFKNTYKYYATLNPVQDVWGIQTGAFFELVNELNLIDNLVKDADVNIKWTSVISGGEKGNPRNPIQAVNRHQFMEIWVRLSEEKYIFKYKSTQSHYEALRMLWDEHLEKHFTKFDQQKWREERYWNEDCDYCLKHYKKLIDYIYKQYAKKKVKPGQVPFMCLDELNQIISLCNLNAEESFGSSVYLFAYNMSMMTQVNEIGSNRLFEMSPVEYYEALARIAEEANLIPVLGPFGVDQDENKDKWTLEKRKNQKLGHKLEALIWRMYECCTDLAYKQNNPVLEKSFFWKDPEESEFDLID
ncbi:hypothetical protein PPERSA_00328 [Pseudocohnilembus persalinus]|uniref:Uncharacterized protein n=1 Tax=Pseudocohnilembus persalinus TaxID=266149 RepID=A0A0V0QHS4_PSEPJ|nr:hypothetical protein PPERSA_00328 [Pseudocohnilembus persalinus]|eukprot:KRX01621.1 hypothetical protein PPERSA_00328 [Pseudocohnilembus persalinus]